jgi:hypothetical protein
MPNLGRRTHDRPFTVVVCQATACEAGADPGLLDALRETIRRCPHGVLLRSGCMLGPVTCRPRWLHPHADTSGAIVIVQPCGTDRAPQGIPVRVGPLRHPGDTHALCTWLERGVLVVPDQSVYSSRPVQYPRHRT